MHGGELQPFRHPESCSCWRYNDCSDEASSCKGDAIVETSQADLEDRDKVAPSLDAPPPPFSPPPLSNATSITIRLSEVGGPSHFVQLNQEIILFCSLYAHARKISG